MPLPSSTPYSKEHKLNKPRHFIPQPPSRQNYHHTPLILILSFLFLLVGIFGIVFSISVLRRPPRVVTVYHCGRSEDSLRTYLSRSGVGDGGGGRKRLLGFVGVQTGFDSADRRVALRSTWFPSDPDGLVNLRMFNNEDVTVGSWMLSMNVNHEDNRAICDTKCTPSSIAVWDMPRCSGLCDPVDKMKELHNISMCSTSPTLPPEEIE